MISIVLYAWGFVLFVLLQAQNSIMSKSNGLPGGWRGMLQWFRSQTINLLFRATLCGLLYEFVIQKVTQSMQAAGLTLHAYAVAGIAGIASSTIIYQASGFIPWFRQEVADVSPPANSEIIPVSPVSKPIPTSETRS